MFKQCLLTLMLAGLIYAAAPAAVAQDAGTNDQQAPPAGGPQEHGRMRNRMDPARRVEMLTTQLNLTPEQKTKVLDIMKADRSKIESLRDDSSLAPQDRRAKMMEIRKASNDQIRALLDSNQQKKFDVMQARQEQGMQGHHPGGEGVGAPPDAPQHAPEQK
jgi:Spy/CpxP family protein refolding chaperone